MIPEVVKVVTTMVPAVKNLRLVRGLIVPLEGAGTMNEAKAIEELQGNVEKRKQQREKARNKQNKRVIKINDAMKCIEDQIGQGQLLIDFGKAILSTITSSRGQDMMDLISGRVLACMISKALQQNNKRTRGKFVRDPDDRHHKKFSETERIRRGKLHPFA